MTIEIIVADYKNAQHSNDIPMLLDHYASDPMGGGTPLSASVKASLIEELSKRPFVFSILAYADGRPVGLVNCLEGFSTFSCQALINVHDIVVLREFRGQGISQQLLEKVEEIARAKDCCKITLEVLSNNEVAKSAYRKFGFTDYELDPQAGSALFWQKLL